MLKQKMVCFDIACVFFVRTFLAWSLGGAEKFLCSRFNRYWWWIWPDTERGGNSFYLEARDGVDPYEYCRERGLLNPRCYRESQPTTLTDFLVCSEEVV